MDNLSKEIRSKTMSKVKSKNNLTTEIRFLEFLKKNQIHGWSRSYNVIGKPDFIFIKNRVAIFIDGCFWHGHDCRNTKPKDNKIYWEAKIAKNTERDKKVNIRFSNRGWKVIRIWECELKDEGKLLKILSEALR